MTAVRVNQEFFNKNRTNLLVTRVGPGLPYLMCVDEDLEYTGDDATLVQAFTGAGVQRGWKKLLLWHSASLGDEVATEQALRLLQRGEGEAVLTPPKENEQQGQADEGILGSFAETIPPADNDSDDPVCCVGREREVALAASCVFTRPQARMALIAGLSGVGKTALLHALADTVTEQQTNCRMLRLELASLFAGTLFHCERERLLTEVLKEAAARNDTIVVLEDLDLACREIPHGDLLLAHALDRNARIVGTTLPQFPPRFYAPPLQRRTHVVFLEEPSLREAEAMVAAHRRPVAKRHGLSIDADLVRAAVTAALPLPGHLPAKALALLNAAAAHAALSRAHVIGLDDIYAMAEAHQPPAREEAEE